MNKVFISGATGFTGQHACGYYKGLGYEVYAAVRDHTLSPIDVRNMHCDLMDPEALRVLFEKVQPDLILHLAAQNHSGRSWNDPITTINTNVIGTMNLLEAAKIAVPHARILITGSVIEFNPCYSTEPNHPYGLSKYIQTLLSRSWSSFYDLDIRIAKTSNLIGPGHSNGICSLFVQKCLQYRQGDTEGFQFHNILDSRDFLDVRDAVRAYDCILQKGRKNETYVVASGETHTLLEVAKELKRLSRSDLPLTTQQFLHTEPVHYVKDKLENLDWNQTIPLKQSLKDIVEYYDQG
ncbi:NAD-dependent epimerase/dehydratase family protein [Rossellomorea vietnamensis]|uniref:NAD-dependent epimerase/dehydratase family protein n=1 Tax=Rossellomorea vietnamensis TaxID=218284 RepID=UPI001E5C6F81|nr:NAD-dependent epimerase/dehydratase family protein [Rossellomorea vietnamensis]MCC5804138.1 GDP-mannose 4,6-dehydratase [Rossellomorea vietnamensis]